MIRAVLTNNDRNIDVSSDNDADTSKVSDVKIGASGFVSGYAPKDCPSSESDEEDTSGRDTSGLLPVGE